MAFPRQRPRRLRSSAAMRRLVAQTSLEPRHLVLPMFVADGIDEPRPISSMPGVVQHTRDSLRSAAADAVAQLQARFAATHANPLSVDYLRAVRETSLLADLQNQRLAFEWTTAQVLYDAPAKTLDRSQRTDVLLFPALMQRLETGRRAGFGSVKVTVCVGATEWRTSAFPSKEHGWMVPVKAAVRKAEGLVEGEAFALSLVF